MSHFVMRNGDTFKVLIQDEAGGWLISCDSPAAPFFVMQDEMTTYERTTPPHPKGGGLSAAAQKRVDIIQPLLDAGEAAITDKTMRLRMVKEIALTHSTTPRRVKQLYYRYLATGQMLAPKARSPTLHPDYEWAIKTFYFSAKRLSLKSTYEMMLLQRFSDHQGRLAPSHPTWGSFRAYFYSRSFHKSPRKIISRQGLTHYQRNCQPAFGNASEWRPPGSYQMDATEADIYILSESGEKRPYIYMAVDSATQLIAGVWVGFECDESAVMLCLENTVGDKVEYCRQHDITITPEQWPSHGLPNEVITDKGREFCGARMEELCRHYGVELISQPPFRPDRKGLVEQGFNLLQARYKPLLRGKGVIEADAQERWGIDYRSQAVLTLKEFTQIIIHCVMYLNSGRVLPSGKTPAQLWMEHSPQLLEVDASSLHIMALPRVQATLTRKGVRVNGITYTPSDMEGLYLGDSCTIAYDPANLTCVYLVEQGCRECRAAPGQGVEGMSLTQHNTLMASLKTSRKVAAQKEIAASASCMAAIQDIVRRNAYEP